MRLVPGNDNNHGYGLESAANDPGVAVEIGDARLRALAQRLLALQRGREALFGEMPPQPAWQLLLLLFAQDEPGAAMPIEEVSAGWGESMTTTLRMARPLVEAGRLSLHGDSALPTAIGLTADGIADLTQLLRDAGLLAAGARHLDPG